MRTPNQGQKKENNNNQLMIPLNKNKELETTIFGQPIEQIGLVPGDINIDQLRHSQITLLIDQTMKTLKMVLKIQQTQNKKYTFYTK